MSFEDRLCWLDMEMTGLDANKCKILEVAIVITDSAFNKIAESPNLIINYPNVLETMEPWSLNQHTKSGLIEKCQQSKTTLDMAEKILLEICQKYLKKGVTPIIGNSIHSDKSFLKLHMPTLNDYFHYRLIDVSSIKELCRRWYPDIFKCAPIKKLKHQALSDIYESMDELKFYQQNIFKQF